MSLVTTADGILLGAEPGRARRPARSCRSRPGRRCRCAAPGAGWHQPQAQLRAQCSRPCASRRRPRRVRECGQDAKRRTSQVLWCRRQTSRRGALNDGQFGGRALRRLHRRGGRVLHSRSERGEHGGDARPGRAPSSRVAAIRRSGDGAERRRHGRVEANRARPPRLPYRARSAGAAPSGCSGARRRRAPVGPARPPARISCRPQRTRRVALRGRRRTRLDSASRSVSASSCSDSELSARIARAARSVDTAKAALVSPAVRSRPGRKPCSVADVGHPAGGDGCLQAAGVRVRAGGQAGCRPAGAARSGSRRPSQNRK